MGSFHVFQVLNVAQNSKSLRNGQKAYGAKRGNRGKAAVSQESADGTHTYTQVQRDKRESVKQIKPSLLLFIPGFVQRRPPFTSPQPRQHLSGKRVINV